MVAATLVRGSFFVQQFGKSAEDPMLSSICLSREELRVSRQEFEINLVFLKAPVPLPQPSPVNRHL